MVGTPSFLFIKATLQSSPKKSSSFCLQSSQQSTQKIFSLPQPFRQFRLPQGTRERVSLVRTDTVLTVFWTVTTGLTITDSLSLSLQKLVFWKCRKPSNPPFFIPSTHCHHFYTLQIPPQEITFLWKQVSWLDFHPSFSILTY